VAISVWVGPTGPPDANIESQDQPSERIYEDQEQLLQDLCNRYKQSKGVLTFLGAYKLPAGRVDNFSIEKRNSIDKSTAEALADSIWDGTKRRWRYENELHSVTASDLRIQGVKTLNTKAVD
jgi:hypothetical protein